MKKSIILIFSLLLIVSFIFAQSTTIDFETLGDGYTPSATEGTGTTDVFNRADVTDFGGNSTFIWAVETISGDPSITLNQIDITGSSSFTFSIDFLTPNSNDWDSTDELLITYSVDGGASQNLIWVQADDDDNYNEPAQLDLDFDGEGDDGQELPAITDGHSAGVGSNFATFSRSNIWINGSNLVITLQFNGLTSTDEGIYIDNITITQSTDIPNIIISEIMQDPNAVGDTDGEWFELYNASGSTVNIDGWKIKDAGSNNHTIDNGGTLNISAGNFIVLGNNSDQNTNGGYICDYQYSNFTLGNTDDEVILTTSANTEVDRVEYDGGTNWPDPTGASMVFTGTSSDDNNAYANWTTATTREQTFTGDTGDNGSPGTNGSDQPLPVNLSAFYALYTGGTPTLYWTTQSEEDNAYWNVYRGNNNNFTEATHLNANDPVSGNGTINSASDYIYVDNLPVVQNTTYWYWIEDVSTDGETEIHEPITLTVPFEDTPITPDMYGLHQNYPNPFNPSTSISFALAEDSDVELIIYNIKGERIKSIFNDHIYEDQITTAIWDGTDKTGKQVSSGVYFYKLITDTKDYSRKMLLIK